MNIHFIGNVCNYAFWWARSTRLLGTHDAKVLVPYTTNPRDVPWWDDPAIDKNNLPNWIYMMPKISYSQTILPLKRTQQVGKMLRQCDFVHAFGAGLFWARHANVPFVYQSYGDITGAPFFERWWPPTRLVGSAVFRRLLQKAEKIIISQLRDILYVKRLRLQQQMVLLPILYDCHAVSPEAVKNNTGLEKKYGDFDILFFSPSRHYSFKGNRKIISAFNRFLKERKESSLLILVNKGSDLEKSKAFISELGIENNIEWIPVQTKHGLMEYMSLPRVAVVDQCWDSQELASLGGISRDAMSMETPLITHVTTEEINRLHDTEPPILWTDHTEESIFKRMVQFAEMSESDRKDIGRQEREWMIKEHHYEKLLPRYFEVYEECL